jgi:hypothetical protein
VAISKIEAFNDRDCHVTEFTSMEIGVPYNDSESKRKIIRAKRQGNFPVTSLYFLINSGIAISGRRGRSGAVSPAL